MNKNIDKKEFFGENKGESFADDFDRAFNETSAEDMEKIFMEELPDMPDTEVNLDGYKDVLSSLSELDPTGNVEIDYLEANKTRTIRLEDEAKTTEAEKNAATEDLEKNMNFPWKLAVIIGIILCFIISYFLHF